MSGTENRSEYSTLKFDKVYSRKPTSTVAIKARSCHGIRRSLAVGEQRILQDISNIQNRLSLPGNRVSIKLVGCSDDDKENDAPYDMLIAPEKSAAAGALSRLQFDVAEQDKSSASPEEWTPAAMAEFAGSEVVSRKPPIQDTEWRGADLDPDISINPKCLQKIWVRRSKNLGGNPKEDHFLKL